MSYSSRYPEALTCTAQRAVTAEAVIVELGQDSPPAKTGTGSRERFAYNHPGYDHLHGVLS